MAPLTAEIDLNVKDGNGLTMVRMDKVEGEPFIGAPINVYESEDNVAGVGVVERINHNINYIYIRVDWDSIHDAESDDNLPQELIESIERARSRPQDRRPRPVRTV